jgi:hypothetical protein
MKAVWTGLPSAGEGTVWGTEDGVAALLAR